MKIYNVFLFLFLTSVLSSCSYFVCTISSYGITPVEKSYYIAAAEPSLDEDLEFQEYANILRLRLNEKGYVETNSQDADLCMYLSYYVGEDQLNSTTTISNSYANIKTNSNTSSKTSARAYGSASTNVHGNSAKTTGSAHGNSSTSTQKNSDTKVSSYSTSTSFANYKTPIGCRIVAHNAKTQKNVWQVDVSNYLLDSQQTSLRKLMPWMLFYAQKHFGTTGEETIEISHKKGKKTGLVWPY